MKGDAACSLDYEDEEEDEDDLGGGGVRVWGGGSCVQNRGIVW